MESIFRKISRYFQSFWILGILDPQKGLWTLEPQESNIAYLRAQNARGRHIFMKPLRLEHYLLADDITGEMLRRHHQLPDGRWKPARMVVETSTKNFQVWIHSDRPLTLDEKSLWLQKLGSDPAAHPHNRWGRCPGFRNNKDKYRSPAGLYPLARLIWVDWNAKAHIPAIDSPTQSNISHPPQRASVCRKASPSRNHFLRDDESSTDFAYALSLARSGCSDDGIRERILSERTNWDNHSGQTRILRYLERTIRKARSLVEST